MGQASSEARAGAYEAIWRGPSDCVGWSQQPGGAALPSQGPLPTAGMRARPPAAKDERDGMKKHAALSQADAALRGIDLALSDHGLIARVTRTIESAGTGFGFALIYDYDALGAPSSESWKDAQFGCIDWNCPCAEIDDAVDEMPLTTDFDVNRADEDKLTGYRSEYAYWAVEAEANERRDNVQLAMDLEGTDPPSDIC